MAIVPVTAMLRLLELQRQALTVYTQNKRRRYNDRDDDREREEDPTSKLQGATTLYVGNLYVPNFLPRWATSSHPDSQILLHNRGADPRALCQVSVRASYSPCNPMSNLLATGAARSSDW